jgi:hypothetical protein
MKEATSRWSPLFASPSLSQVRDPSGLINQTQRPGFPLPFPESGNISAWAQSEWLDGVDPLAHNSRILIDRDAGNVCRREQAPHTSGREEDHDDGRRHGQKARIAISCTIVDAGGHMILLERMDGGRLHTVRSCTRKAVCAASNRRLTTMASSETRPQLRSRPAGGRKS